MALVANFIGCKGTARRGRTPGRRPGAASHQVGRRSAVSLAAYLRPNKAAAKVGFFISILMGLLALEGAWAAIKRFFGIGTKDA